MKIWGSIGNVVNALILFWGIMALTMAFIEIGFISSIPIILNPIIIWYAIHKLRRNSNA